MLVKSKRGAGVVAHLVVADLLDEGLGCAIEVIVSG